jgi:hypothetical protein
MAEENKAVATTAGATVAVYGENQDVAQLQKRIMIMLPQVARIGTAAAYGLAQVSLAMGLNPFIGEIWAIPSQGGYAIQGGIKGIRRSAHKAAQDDGGMYITEFRRPTDLEVEGLIINPGDIVRACDVFVSGRRAEAFRALTGKVPKFTGIGIYRKGESTRMNPLQCVRKRAEADALKQAFDLPLMYGGDKPEEVDFVEAGVYDRDYDWDKNRDPDVTAPTAAAELFGDYVSDGDQPLEAEIVEDDVPPEIEAEQPPAPNWVNDPDITKRFYIWFDKQKWLDGTPITKGDLYKLLGVSSSLKEYAGGTVGDVKQIVKDAIAAKKAETE